MDARKKAKLEALEIGTNDFSFSSPATNALPDAPLVETLETASRPFTGSFAGLDMLAKWYVSVVQLFLPTFSLTFRLLQR